jgi:ABC-type multidrug transport system fused ATPase/permease subunit
MNGLDLFSVAKRIERENKGKVGENGAKLSGGEIKKICIARALLKKHSVIIFDEAMSNIDARSMHFILSELNRSDAIMIVIDHSNNLEKYGFKKICLA